MIRLAKIVQINSKEVRLRLESTSECSDCKSRCSDGFLSFLFHKKNNEDLVVSLANEDIEKSHLRDEDHFFQGPYSNSDIIAIKFDERELFRLSLFLYGMPIILIIAMLIMGYMGFSWLNLNADLGGVLGFVVAMYLSKKLIKSNGYKLRPQVKYFK